VLIYAQFLGSITRNEGTRIDETASQHSQSLAYAQAGVDIDSKSLASRNQEDGNGDDDEGCVGGIGSFGGLFHSPGKNSCWWRARTGDGTKLKVAALAKKHDTVGQDIVNHCVNEILVQGRSRFSFMDYIGTARFDTAIFKDVVAGVCKACKENDCALLGGEDGGDARALSAGRVHLVGTFVGMVEKKKVITGKDIKPGRRDHRPSLGRAPDERLLAGAQG
jgi:phosphoribosylformylglycinamidine cyclo-ligase